MQTAFLHTGGARAQSQSSADFAGRMESSPTLPFHRDDFLAKGPNADWASGMVSSVAIGRDGLLYELQRGDKADPILVIGTDGRVVGSWGKGNYKLPHSIRLDSSGNIWTVDASSSVVTKYSPIGKKLLTIRVGGQPKTDTLFSGATDIAFAPNGHLFITDGYCNARILEYSASGKRLRQWGKAGDNPGEFHLPHAIQISDDGIIYIADRENGRIEKFDSSGKYLGQIRDLGRIYSLKLDGNVLWAGTQRLDQPPGSPGWLIKLDRHSGEILGHLDVKEAFGLHSVDLTPSGEPVTVLGNQILWFRRDAPYGRLPATEKPAQ
jgi:hypothetical protein